MSNLDRVIAYRTMRAVQQANGEQPPRNLRERILAWLNRLIG